MFVLQNNNIPAQKLVQLRKDLAQSHLEVLNVRNGVFAAAAKRDGKRDLTNLFQGQTMVWFSNATDSENPKLLQDVAKIADQYKQFVFLTGGMMENIILTADTFQDVKALPPKAVLFAEILGLIQYPGTTIASILSQTPQTLAANLDQHVKQLNKES
jgi:ribosomal protein L10